MSDQDRQELSQRFREASELHDGLSCAVYKGFLFRSVLAENPRARQAARDLFEILDAAASNLGFSLVD